MTEDDHIAIEATLAEIDPRHPNADWMRHLWGLLQPHAVAGAFRVAPELRPALPPVGLARRRPWLSSTSRAQ